MKVLIINGSPKGEKSNTMKLTRAFAEGAGWTDAEIIETVKADIKSCRGCFACWNKTPGACVIKDGMSSDILPKIIAADVIIWAFPLYYYSVPGGLKNLIDRQLPLNLPYMAEGAESGGHPPRYDLSHQKHIVISTCGFWTAKGNYGGVTATFDHCHGEGNYTSLFCGQGELFTIAELKQRTDAYLSIVRRAGAEYAAGGIQADTSEELAEPLFPRDVFEKAADASWGIEQNTDSAATAAELSDDSLKFTAQMAAFYKPDGTDRVLEMHYTDIDKTYQIVMTSKGAEVIAKDFKPYTTRIETPYTVWRAISRGEITGQEALFQRQYTVLGDFSPMLKWDDLFVMSVPKKENSAESDKTKTNEHIQRKTNMTVLLIPWIVIWVGMAIHPTIGSAAGIITAALVPLLWLCFKPVVFEQITLPVIAGLSLAVLFGVDTRLIVPAAYLLFGMMWFIGAFTKIPLTAYYSASGYGGAKAFANPLFVRTNRILTAAWGILYLITPIWTYIIMGTSLSPWIGLINNICPILLGIFTAWFQKWYPAHFAKKGDTQN
ncbi:MAG: NAD(P)H-dependent oxidoreductase [Spirochaetaceae bacterium]|jgi:multimeric flavodoxin WrbA|nr:NAD(P)H-dependent oxidoreductase [Spirochaetaceae bacterium]